MDPLKMMEQRLNKLGAMANELDAIDVANSEKGQSDGYVDESIKQLPNPNYFLGIIQSWGSKVVGCEH